MKGGCSLDLEKMDQNSVIYEPFEKLTEHLGKSGSSKIHPDFPILYLPIHVSFICGHSQFLPKSFQQQQKVASTPHKLWPTLSRSVLLHFLLPEGRGSPQWQVPGSKKRWKIRSGR